MFDSHKGTHYYCCNCCVIVINDRAEVKTSTVVSPCATRQTLNFFKSESYYNSCVIASEVDLSSKSGDN